MNKQTKKQKQCKISRASFAGNLPSDWFWTGVTIICCIDSFNTRAASGWGYYSRPIRSLPQNKRLFANRKLILDWLIKISIMTLPIRSDQIMLLAYSMSTMTKLSDHNEIMNGHRLNRHVVTWNRNKFQGIIWLIGMISLRGLSFIS